MTTIMAIVVLLGCLFIISRPFLVELIIKKARRGEVFNNPYELLPHIYPLLLERYGFVMNCQLAIEFQVPVELIRQKLDFLVAKGHLSVSGDLRMPLYSIPDRGKEYQCSTAMAIATV